MKSPSSMDLTIVLVACRETGFETSHTKTVTVDNLIIKLN
jgi:hypothetical protein